MPAVIVGSPLLTSLMSQSSSHVEPIWSS
jgi:transposase